MNRRLPLIALLATACGPGKSPLPEQVWLQPSADSVLIPFAEVTEAAWIDGNRWAILAPGGPVAEIVDIRAASRKSLRGGSKAVDQPYALFRAGDSLYTNEALARRTAIWGLDGTFGRVEPASSAVRGALPRARDPQNRFIVELRPPAGVDGSGNRDSASIVRLGTTVDTLAHLAPLDLAKVQGTTGERFEQRVFSGTDRWGMLDDGTLWLARVYHNRVDFRAPDGPVRKGDPLPDRVLEVTREDREAFVAKFPPELKSSAEQLPYAPLKAAFTNAFSDGRGQVWLERSRALADTLQTYHVVDRGGRLTRILAVPARAQVVGASPTHALVATVGRNGVTLREAPIPAPSVPAK